MDQTELQRRIAEIEKTIELINGKKTEDNNIELIEDSISDINDTVIDINKYIISMNEKLEIITAIFVIAVSFGTGYALGYKYAY